MNLDPEKGHADASFQDVAAVHVHIDDISVSFKSTPAPWERPLKLFSRKKSNTAQSAPKIVLDHVSAHLPAGSLTAILGGSGSGKTTLLNTISHRVTSSKLHVSGQAIYNGSSDLSTVRSSYVMQSDVLLPTLTIRESLRYAADLRLPDTTQAERTSVIEGVILDLGLKEAANTRIGNSSQKGASGGEKRRTSIGVQMLANPSILFCDEPTTGLDAYSAFQVVKRLKQLAENGRTLIMSIHAPRSEIVALFDQVILLAHGATLYTGSAEGAITHFNRLGYPLPAFCNPAEHLIDLAAIDNRSEELESTSRRRVEMLQAAWRVKTVTGPEQMAITPHVSASAHTHQKLKEPSPTVGLVRQVKILTRRTISTTIRDPMGMAASLFEACSMTIITGWIFLQLGQDLAGVRSREGALYNAASLQGYLVLLFETYRLTFDIQLFDRENKEGVVSVKAFIISRRLARLFLEDLPVPTLFTLIYYFMTGLRLNASAFFIFYLVMVIAHYIAVNLALVCVAVSRNFAGASLIANLCYTLQSLACGYFVQANQIPVYVRWLKWTAYNFYVLGALVSNEFVGVNGPAEGQFYDCPATDANPSNPACLQYTGRFVVESLGFPGNWLWRPIVVATAYGVFFFLLAGLILRFKKVEIDVVTARKNDDNASAIHEKMESSISTGSVVPVAVELDSYGLEVQIRQVLKRCTVSKTILSPVTCTFEPGRINTIMGPSGSGKTSLLQSLAQRLDSTVTSIYTSSGHIRLNGAIPSSDVMRSVASFVTQDDDALMGELTVRETLRFAAGLRLPASMSPSEKTRHAEDVLLKMGLRDCADNVVGSELKKGISGGEKRRVSIAIQILTNPKVLLLDEPTSGLDAFTATSIIDVLATLASEGRTIIMTIHQARSDVFEIFDNVLLLARGGSPVYSGAGSDMLSHFTSLGYDCSTTTNPADFVLDAITVDLQEAGKEAQSRSRVQRIIDAWNKKEEARPRLKRAESATATPAELNSLKRQMNPFPTTFPLVMHRSIIQIFRSPEIMLARTMQVIGIGGIFALFFAPLQKNYEGIQSNVGFIQEVAALYFVGMLQNLSVYPAARSLFYREHADSCYGTVTFLLTYTLLEIPFTAVSSIAFGALCYAINLKRTIGFLFISALNCFAIITCGESVGIIFCTLFKSHVGFSVQIMSIVLSVANILGGIMSLNIPRFLQAWNYLSPIKYQVANMAAFGLSDTVFTCSNTQKADGRCPVATGEEVLQLYKLDVNAGTNLAALAACVVVYRLVAFLLLWAARKHWHWDWAFGWLRRRKRGVGSVDDVS